LAPAASRQSREKHRRFKAASLSGRNAAHDFKGKVAPRTRRDWWTKRFLIASDRLL
jgi:hypothetical protein